MHDHVDLMRICRAADTHGVDMTMQILGRSGDFPKRPRDRVAEAMIRMWFLAGPWHSGAPPLSRRG
jgi:hypothetical protein